MRSLLLNTLQSYFQRQRTSPLINSFNYPHKFCAHTVNLPRPIPQKIQCEYCHNFYAPSYINQHQRAFHLCKVCANYNCNNRACRAMTFTSSNRCTFAPSSTQTPSRVLVHEGSNKRQRIHIRSDENLVEMVIERDWTIWERILNLIYIFTLILWTYLFFIFYVVLDKERLWSLCGCHNCWQIFNLGTLACLVWPIPLLSFLFALSTCERQASASLTTQFFCASTIFLS